MTRRARFEPSGPLQGTYTPPPDKSISHRAAMFAAMSDEPVAVRNYLRSEDTESTLSALQSLGAGVEDDGNGVVLVRGVGLHAPLEATGGLLDVGNSGTLMRLLPGWLAGQPGRAWTLDGDESIRRRPVDRVVEPLAAMGAGWRPVTGAFLRYGQGGRADRHQIPAARGERPGEVVRVDRGHARRGLHDGHGAAPSRDHTERLMRAAQCPVLARRAG